MFFSLAFVFKEFKGINCCSDSDPAIYSCCLQKLKNEIVLPHTFIFDQSHNCSKNRSENCCQKKCSGKCKGKCGHKSCQCRVPTFVAITQFLQNKLELFPFIELRKSITHSYRMLYISPEYSFLWTPPKIS